VEAANRRDVRGDAQAGPDLDSLDRPDVVHLVCNIFTIVQIVDWLAVRISIGDRRPVLERRDSLFWRKVGVSDAPTERRVDRPKTKGVRAPARGVCGEIGIEPRQLMRGHIHNGYSGYGLVAQALTRKHKTNDGCKSQWFHITFSLYFNL
jgi:hypothetical protein